MNINPFELLKNFQNMQAKMKDFQSKIKDITVTGSSGGDMVSIDMDGQMNVRAVRITPEVVNPAEIEMLQDLIQAAVTDAMIKIRTRIKEEASELTGGINLPPDILGL